MNWLTANWYWILAAIIIVIIISNKARSSKHMSKAQAEALVDLLVEAFDSILTTILPDRYDSYDRRKIALGMVAIMASQNISLDKMEKNPKLVVTLAAQSAAVLVRAGQIAPL